jgi:hypothetical protein
MATQPNTTAKPGKTRKFAKEVDSNYATPWEPKAVGDVLEGKYLGFDVIPGSRKGETFRSYRILKDGDEKPHGVAGAMLASKLIRVPKGTYVQVTYIGTKKTGNGEAKDFKVLVEEGVNLIDSNFVEDNDIPE